MNFIKNKKGHSLIELIVAIGITTIMIAAVFFVFSSMFGSIEISRKDSRADSLLENSGDYIKNTTGKTINSLEIYTLDDAFEKEFDINCYALAVIDGKLYDFKKVEGKKWSEIKLNTHDFRVFNEDYYNNSDILVAFKKFDNKRRVEMTLTAEKEGKPITRSRRVNYILLDEKAELVLLSGEEDRDILILYFKV